MTIRILFAISAAALLFACTSRAQPIEWHITPIVADGAVVRLDMTLSFTGDADGETVLELPDNWGGEQELYRALWDITAEGAVLESGETPARPVLRHDPGAAITLRWKLGAGPDTPPAKQGGNDYRPRFTPDHVFVIGYAALPWPDHVDNDAPARIRLDRPDGLAFVSDLDHAGPSGHTTFGDLARSALYGGNIRVIESGQARLALSGSFDNLDDAFWTDAFSRIAAGERRYWDSKDEPFLVTIIAQDGEPGATSIGGTGLGDAFSLFSTSNIASEEALMLIAHEMMHSWVPGRIGRMPEENEAAHYWLSEGFTDWATFRVLIREGIWTPEEFAAAFNASAFAFGLSPVRNADSDEIARRFWSSAEMSRLPYQKGMLIAAWLDGRIRTETGGAQDLDDVLLAMQRAAAGEPDAMAHDLLVRMVTDITGWDPAADLDAMAMQGGDVDLPTDLFAPCGLLVSTERPMWDRGFDFSATSAADWKIQGVTEGNAAWQAGLRNGMELRSWSENSNERDPTIAKTALVTEGDGLRAITWLPSSQEVRRVVSFDLAPDLTAETEAACKARLSGL